MNYTNKVNEAYVISSSKKPILELSATFIQQWKNDFSQLFIRQKIYEREKIGDTFIGNKTVILHIISKKNVEEFGLYLFLRHQQVWRSVYNNQEHKIDRVIILAVNPKYKEHYFNHIQWATEYDFINNENLENENKLYFL